jgi:hypothetical protein
MPEMSLDEITILSATDAELYAYIKPQSIEKDWPFEMSHNGLQYIYEAYWTLPTSMGNGFVQAARYIRSIYGNDNMCNKL